MYRQFIDEVLGEPVETENQVKGYGMGDGDYVILEPEKIAVAIPESEDSQHRDVPAVRRVGDVTGSALIIGHHMAEEAPEAASSIFRSMRSGRTTDA